MSEFFIINKTLRDGERIKQQSYELIRQYGRRSSGFGSRISAAVEGVPGTHPIDPDGNSLTYENGGVLDHFSFGGSSALLGVRFEIYNSSSSTWQEMHGMYTWTDGWAPQTISAIYNNQEGDNGMWEILQYDTVNSIFVVKLREPLHFHSTFRVRFLNYADESKDLKYSYSGKRLL